MFYSTPAEGCFSNFCSAPAAGSFSVFYSTPAAGSFFFRMFLCLRRVLFPSCSSTPAAGSFSVFVFSACDGLFSVFYSIPAAGSFSECLFGACGGLFFRFVLRRQRWALSFSMFPFLRRLRIIHAVRIVAESWKHIISSTTLPQTFKLPITQGGAFRLANIYRKCRNV